MSELFEKMTVGLVEGNAETVIKLVNEALDQSITAKDILDHGLIAGMGVVGEKMKTGEMFIPEVLHSAKVMQKALDLLRPQLSDQESSGLGIYILGTVEGDMHDIGKNLVSMMLGGAGFKVVDLGTNVKPQDFVAAVKEHQPLILGMSALLTTTMPKMKETIEALKEAGVRDQVKIMAGGAPVTQNFIDEIGADAYGSNAAVAADVAKTLIS
jgi:5-methyltetrahydrofolate--homocysteine methyltransferase